MERPYEIGDRVLGDWVICEQLGAGSFGRVYRIERREFGEVYEAALKVITVPASGPGYETSGTEGMSIPETEQYYYSVVEELAREIALMSKLKGTAHVVGYEDHQVIRHEQGIGWDILIRMEKLTPLTAYMAGHTMTRHEVIRLGIHLCQALELCRKKNIIHRDIKPENIFVSENGDFKLGDFGIARTVERASAGLSRKGTYHYMAPEVYRGENYGFDVDSYSLGIVLYKLLNQNRLPFCPLPPTPLTYSVLEEALALRIRGEKLPKAYYATEKLDRIIQKATAFSPKERYINPADMQKDLEELLRSDPDRLLEDRVADGILSEDHSPSDPAGDLELTVRWGLKDDGTVCGRQADLRSQETPVFMTDLHMNEERDRNHWRQVQPPISNVPNGSNPTRRCRIWLPLLIVGLFLLAAASGFLLWNRISEKTAAADEQQISNAKDKESGQTAKEPDQTETESELELAGLDEDSLLGNEDLIAACALYETGDYVEAASAFIEIMNTSDDTEAAQRAFRLLAELYRDCAQQESSGMAGLFEKKAVLLELEILQQGIARYQLYYDSSLYEMLGMAAYQAYEQGYMDGLDTAKEAFEKVLELGMQKEYIYTNLYTIAYMQHDLFAAEEVTYSMEETFSDSYLPHAFRAIIYIEASGNAAYCTTFRDHYGLTEEESYETAYGEYKKAKELVTATDDRTYFSQLESLIQELIVAGWLENVDDEDIW